MTAPYHTSQVLVTADLPGIPRENIRLTVDRDVLTIAGERKQERGDPERGYYERSYGRFRRAVRLPQGIRPEGITATSEHGVLRVDIPKESSESRKPHSIEVK